MREGRCAVAVIGFVVMASLFVGCSSGTSPDANAPGSGSSGLHVSSAGLGPAFDNPADMCTATLVAVGAVVAFGPPHWNTVDGQKPADASLQTISTKGYLIYTPVHLSFSSIAVDHRTNKTVEFDAMGGRVGNDSYQGTDFAHPVTGQEYLMVLFPGVDGTRSTQTQSSLVIYRAFPINSAGVQLRSKLTEQGQVTQQELVLPLSAVLQQLSACK
jgi:hypothetical protein